MSKSVDDTVFDLNTCSCIYLEKLYLQRIIISSRTIRYTGTPKKGKISEN